MDRPYHPACSGDIKWPWRSSIRKYMQKEPIYEEVDQFSEPIKVQEVAVVSKETGEVRLLQPSQYMMQEGFIEEMQLLRLMQRTPINHIFQRPAKGGGIWDYVTITYIQKVLNFVFGWDWDFEIVSYEEKYNQVQVLGKLTVRGKKGKSVTKMQFGRADIKYKTKTETKNGKKLKVKTDEVLDFGNDLKAAASDSLKKCASELGVASDIFGKNEFREVAQTADSKSKKEPKNWSDAFNKEVIKRIHGSETFDECFKRLFPNLEYPTEQVEAQKMMAQLLRKDQ